MTYTELSGKWASRDRLYAMRRHTLDFDEVTAVRDWRQREASELNKPERMKARAAVLSWHAPKVWQSRTSAA